MNSIQMTPLDKALQIFQVKGDDYRQCFYDRLENIRHKENQTANAIDDLICYSNAIKTQEEYDMVCLALEAIVQGLDGTERGRLHELLAERLKWSDVDDTPRDRLLVLVEWWIRPVVQN